MIKQRNITLIVVHCTASRCTSNLTPEALDSMHKRQGFTECGYHYYITKDGTIHHCVTSPNRSPRQRLQHPSIGVAYEGGLDATGRAADTPHRRAKTKPRNPPPLPPALHPAARICGHRDLSPDLNHNGTIEPANTSNSVPVSVSPSNTVI